MSRLNGETLFDGVNHDPKRPPGRPRMVADPTGRILNKRDVAALTGRSMKTVENWVTPSKRDRMDPPIPAYDNVSSAVWLRETIMPWLVVHRLVPFGSK